MGWKLKCLTIIKGKGEKTSLNNNLFYWDYNREGMTEDAIKMCLY